MFCFATIVLAAGRSRRMGQPKLLLPWSESTVLAHLLQQWETLDATQTAIVTAADAPTLEVELNRLNFPNANRILNPDPDRGMFSSIRCASAWDGWRAELTHFLITLGDQPHLKTATLQQLIEFAAAHPEKICQPLRNGKRRHPVILPKQIFFELAKSPVANLKEFLCERTSSLAGFESDDAGLDLDMDTPADYERLRELNGH